MTPAAAAEVGRDVAALGFRGVYVDGNAVAPDTTLETVPTERIVQELALPGLASSETEERFWREERVRRGEVGSFLFLTDPKKINRLQKIAMTEQRLHIPILFGFDVIHGFDTEFPVPLAMAASWDPAMAEQQERMRAHVVLRFHEKVDSLLVSGLLANGDELAGKAAVVDAPVGSGHVVLFGIRPLWRWESQGSFALALNAIANWDHLGF